MLSKELYRTYVQILKDELVPAMGCTEPIAIAYAGAVARKTLGALPERVEVAVSRNIIKNVNIKKADEFNFSAILFLFFIINFINICNTINSDIIGINILTM